MTDVGAGISARWLPVAVALAGAGVVADLWWQGAAVGPLVVAGALAAAAALVPASPAPLLLLLVAAAVTTALGDDPLRPAVLVLVPLGHAVHLGAALGALLPRGARLHPAALGPPLRRAAAVQVGVFAAVGVLALLPAGRTPPVLEVAALLSVAGVAVLVLVLDRSR